MCGVFGVISRKGNKEEVLRQSISALHHRGPDGSGIWIEGPVGLSHTRLSVHDLSKAASQPMQSEGGRYVIIFNGEIYNYRAIRLELRSLDFHFRSDCDTEVLVNSIEAWGIEKSLKKIVGMFAFAVWDRKKKIIIIARDRFGEKPLYFGEVEGEFVFSSELTAIQKIYNTKLSINKEALALYLRYNMIPAPFSIFVGIHKLEPATYMTYDMEGKIKFKSYWSVVSTYLNAKTTALNLTSCADVLEDKLKDIISSQMSADVNVGCFLSGGIDSSTVAAIMQSVSGRPINTFSIGTESKSLNEAVYAKEIAKHLNTNHNELYVTPEMVKISALKMAEIYGEPFSDPSQIPTFLVSDLAKKKVTVCLSGDGGDEVFGGYNRYLFKNKINNRISNPIRFLLLAISRYTPNTLIKLLNLERVSGVQKIIDLLYKVKLAFSKDSSSVLDFYNDSLSVCKAPHKLIVNNSYYDALTKKSEIKELRKGLRGLCFQDILMLLDVIVYMADDILVKVDRASMACSLETRAPFLDHGLYEFSASLPLSFKINGGCTKRILRQVLYRHIPKALMDRPKMGFGIPISSWLKGELKDWAFEIISSSISDDYINNENVLKYWSDHQSGKYDRSKILWSIIMLNLWLENNLSMSGNSNF